MLADSQQSLRPSISNVNTALEERTQRVWHYSYVFLATWLIYAVFLSLRGYSCAAKICVVFAVVLTIGTIALRKSKNHRLNANFVLGTCLVGLLPLSLCHPTLRWVMLFYPLAIMVSSQLFGVRSAFHWLLLCWAANLAHVLLRFGIDGPFTGSQFDEFMILSGASTCIFFCCYQAEVYFRLRTKHLVELSDGLQQQSVQLHVLATVDSLTGLMNRFQFQKELESSVAISKSENQSMALFVIDMDGFKEINDTLGHKVGDEALKIIAERLRSEFGDDSIIARLGGDEFCIIHMNVKTPECVAQIATRVKEVLCQSYKTENNVFAMGASVGVAICPVDTSNAKDLLAFADTAMYRAKENKLVFANYEPGMTQALVEYRSTQERLSQALNNEEFFLVYQPKVDLRTNEVTGVEALLRWRRDGEIISPFHFIPLLEQSNEIVAVGQWLMQEACRQLKIWTEEGYDVHISVNVSPVQFEDSRFLQYVGDAIRENKVDPSKLDFEITEGLLIDDVQSTIEKLNSLKALGATISIDDFGTGYSSLAYLRQFPIDRLKIDRAFVKDIPSADDGVLASSIVMLGKTLGLKVLAEGVETIEQLQYLRDHHCDEYQGYYLSAPVSPNDVTQYFERDSLPVS